MYKILRMGLGNFIENGVVERGFLERSIAGRRFTTRNFRRTKSWKEILPQVLSPEIV